MHVIKCAKYTKAEPDSHQLPQRVVRVLDVDLREQHPQLVTAADLLEALVDVVGVEQVVAHAQEDGAGALADHVVGEDLVVEFPRHAAYRFEDGVASLAGAHLHKVQKVWHCSFKNQLALEPRYLAVNNSP